MNTVVDLGSRRTNLRNWGKKTNKPSIQNKMFLRFPNRYPYQCVPSLTEGMFREAWPGPGEPGAPGERPPGAPRAPAVAAVLVLAGTAACKEEKEKNSWEEKNRLERFKYIQCQSE